MLAATSSVRFAIKECIGLIGNVLLHVPLVPWHTTMNTFARKHPALLLTVAQLSTAALQDRAQASRQVRRVRAPQQLV